MIVDQTHWGHIRITGEDRVRFMQGMCTANVEALAPGDWLRASILSTKGRVRSVIELVRRDGDLLLTCEPSLTDKTLEILDKHAIMDDVAFAVVSQPMHRVWTSAADVWDAPPILAAPPEPAADPDAVEVLRVEAGMPKYDVDVCEDYFPFESPLARHVDYEKGCYLGQEPISRVHFRGNPGRALRGLRCEGDTPVTPGAVIAHPDRPNAGAVTSAVVSPRLGPIALGYVHRSVFEPGTAVTVDGRSATLTALPFP